MLERRLYFHIDWAMIGAILAICVIGLAQIYSTTYVEGSGASSIFYTQIYGIVLGLFALVVALALVAGAVIWSVRALPGSSASPAAPARQAELPADTIPVRQGRFETTLAITGRLRAHRTAAVELSRGPGRACDFGVRQADLGLARGGRSRRTR